MGWKKNSNGYILPETQKGTTADLKQWLPVDSLHTIACTTLHSEVSPNLSLEIDRIDMRKEKGSVILLKEQMFLECL